MIQYFPFKANNTSNAMLIIAFAISIASAIAGEADCGPLTNHYGPFDYRSAPQSEKTLVERPHFPPKVEQLISGNTAYLGQDISYTLGVFPNHPRALQSMAKLALREKTAKPRHSSFTIDCWFDRAFRYTPNDPTPRMLYGIYLLQLERNEEGIKYLESASELAGDNPNINYNLGLAYLKVHQYEKALKHAHLAYSRSHPLPGLRNLLVKAGKWQEMQSQPDQGAVSNGPQYPKSE